VLLAFLAVAPVPVKAGERGIHPAMLHKCIYNIKARGG
jgi:hypothetical protein